MDGFKPGDFVYLEYGQTATGFVKYGNHEGKGVIVDIQPARIVSGRQIDSYAHVKQVKNFFEKTHKLPLPFGPVAHPYSHTVYLSSLHHASIYDVMKDKICSQ